MPKIIENLEYLLIQEAQRQIEAEGYSTLTMRSVAKGRGVGVGTVYNYFPSKDALLASFMLRDWKQCMVVIHGVSTYSQSPEPVARCIYDQLTNFAQKHEKIFRGEAAFAVFAGSFTRYHSLLRTQLAQPLQQFCDCDFTAVFIAEALLTWTMVN